MFDFLIDKMQTVLKNVRGQGKLTEKNISEALHLIQVSLLQADVHYQVVRTLLANIKVRALSQKVLTSITPAQQFIKIFHDELIKILGEEHKEPKILTNALNIWLISGLQGSGKTTTIAKLSNFYRRQGLKILLVSLDVYRPAAQTQLKILSAEAGVEYFEPAKNKIRNIVKDSLNYAAHGDFKLLICDTAGRLHIDKDMMNELKDVRKGLKPTELFYVADSMTGQEAVNTAKAFNDAVGINGVILTKMDSDTKGGAALSIKYILNKPIYFVTNGEKIEDLEKFYPDRMASRILNMGDVVTLVEKASRSMDEKKAKEYEKKLLQNKFDFQDFLEQLRQIKSMGPLETLMKMIPGMGSLKGMKIDDNQLNHIEAIINSMTRNERLNPKLINGSRRQRIVKGSGTSLQDVNGLLRQFQMMKKMMKKFKKGSRMFKGLPGMGFN